MLLSFSVPAMLPMIINGIPAASATNDVWQWYDSIWNPIYDVPDTDRIKGQTIRRIIGNKSRYMDLKPGHDLHLWWKSRTLQRKKLGIVACSGCELIRLTRGHKIKLNGRVASHEQLERLAMLDGFNSADEFIGFFIPKRKDEFFGIDIKWDTV